MLFYSTACQIALRNIVTKAMFIWTSARDITVFYFCEHLRNLVTLAEKRLNKFQCVWSRYCMCVQVLYSVIEQAYMMMTAEICLFDLTLSFGGKAAVFSCRDTETKGSVSSLHFAHFL